MLPDAVERMDVISSLVLLLLKKKLLSCFSGSIVRLFFTALMSTLRNQSMLLWQLEYHMLSFVNDVLSDSYILLVAAFALLSCRLGQLIAAGLFHR